MKMKSIWTGAIGFGLVNIPVKLFSAVEDSGLNLDMLDKKDHSHIRFMRVNENTGEEVKWENIVKAYDYNGKYIVLTDKDFEIASPEKTKRIEIFQFAHLEEIDSIYFESPYYIEPDKSGDKPYALLKQALEKSQMAGIGSFVLRNREHLAVIKVYEDVLVLNKIRYQQELRGYTDLKVPSDISIKPAELKMANDLIKQMTAPFDISAYKDHYSEQLMNVIKSKSKGTKIKEPVMEVVRTPKTDLMEQLKASLASNSKKKAS